MPSSYLYILVSPQNISSLPTKILNYLPRTKNKTHPTPQIRKPTQYKIPYEPKYQILFSKHLTIISHTQLSFN